VLATLVAVIGHGVARILTHKKAGNRT